MKIAVIGATGVLGRPVVDELLRRDHRVVAIVRRPVEHAPLHAGLTIVRGDILDAPSLALGLEGCDVALHLATAIPKSNGASDWSLNDAIRRDGTRNLVEACHRLGVRGYVQQSVAMLLAGSKAAMVDEDAPLAPSPVLASAADMEAIVAASDLRWTILRGGLFYGPGAGRTAEWNHQARAGELVVPGDGSDYVSLVHVDDMAAAVVLAAERQLERRILNIVDDRPVTYRELFEFIATLNRGPAPSYGGPVRTGSVRVGNARARQALDWAPRYADYRAGWTSDA